ncbi:MAG TPA: phasin family protein [Thermoanaerobaculia bacterium]|nr:phasin family protein [Thermoanaerobaculia bacterium]
MIHEIETAAGKTGARESRELFDRLVERGRPLAETQREALARWSAKAQKATRDLGRLMTDTVEYEVRGALLRFGLATRDDLKALEVRLDALGREVDELEAIEAVDA